MYDARDAIARVEGGVVGVRHGPGEIAAKDFGGGERCGGMFV